MFEYYYSCTCKTLADVFCCSSITLNVYCCMRMPDLKCPFLTNISKPRMFRFDCQEAESPRLSVVYLESRFFHTTIKIAKYVLCCRPGKPAIVQFLDATDPCFSLWCCVDCMESVIASHQGISILFYYFILIPSRNIIIRCSVSCVLNCTRVAPSCVTCLTLAAGFVGVRCMVSFEQHLSYMYMYDRLV